MPYYQVTVKKTDIFIVHVEAEDEMEADDKAHEEIDSGNVPAADYDVDTRVVKAPEGWQPGQYKQARGALK